MNLSFYEDILEIIQEKIQYCGEIDFLYYILNNYNLFIELMDIPYEFVDDDLHGEVKRNIQNIENHIIYSLKERLEQSDKKNAELRYKYEVELIEKEEYKNKFEKERQEKEKLIAEQNKTHNDTIRMIEISKWEYSFIDLGIPMYELPDEIPEDKKWKVGDYNEYKTPKEKAIRYLFDHWKNYFVTQGSFSNIKDGNAFYKYMERNEVLYILPSYGQLVNVIIERYRSVIDNVKDSVQPLLYRFICSEILK